MRSLLFVPADSEAKLAKALKIGADALILDLEDSVARPVKGRAREMARDFLERARAHHSRPRLYVRINDMQTDDWEADLTVTLAARPDGLMLPKPRSGEDVHRLSIALHHAEAQAQIGPGSTRIIAIATEVPASLLHIPSYVGASARLEALAWGAEDLSAAIGATATRDETGAWTSPFRLARDMCLLTAAAAGVGAIDTVHINFRDSEGLAKEALAAARDGFSGKLAIHPNQVAIINEAFTPSPHEIAAASEVVRRFHEAGQVGVVSLGGQMLDQPHLKRAERVLARARLAGVIE